jgi:cyclic pyranopterin monophosphate synthase
MVIDLFTKHARRENPNNGRDHRIREGIMSSKLTHMDEGGNARMVDVSSKEPTKRSAKATAFVRMLPATLASIREANLPKGDVLSTARLAGIMGAKQTSTLIPLCHPLPLESIDVEFTLKDAGVHIVAEARTSGKTGVEMEALTAASIAALTIYDMAKAVDRGMCVEGLRLLEKHGGKSGSWILEEG